MRMTQQSIAQIATELREAERTRTPISPLSDRYPDLNVESAYGIQLANAMTQMKHGQRLIGYKVGLTSREAQKHFGVFEPDFGHLFDSMVVAEEGEVDLTKLIQPKIEGEIAFILSRDLKGPGVTVVDVIEAIDCVLPALEIIDSRIKDWKIKASDTIADNGSSALCVLGGKKTKLSDLNLPFLGMALYANGHVMATGAGAAVLGNPLNAVVFLANELGKNDRSLMAGELILSGSVSGMIRMKPKDSYECEFHKLGRVAIRTEGEA